MLYAFEGELLLLEETMSTNNLDPKDPRRKGWDWMDDEAEAEPSDSFWTMMSPRAVAILVIMIAAAVFAGYGFG